MSGIEILLYMLRPTLQLEHAGACHLLQALDAAYRRPTMHPAFQVTVQVLIGIQLRRIRRQKKNFQAAFHFRLRQPALHAFGVVDAPVIQNQEHLAGRGLDQRPQALDQLSAAM